MRINRCTIIIFHMLEHVFLKNQPDRKNSLVKKRFTIVLRTRLLFSCVKQCRQKTEEMCLMEMKIWRRKVCILLKKKVKKQKKKQEDIQEEIQSGFDMMMTTALIYQDKEVYIIERTVYKNIGMGKKMI